ncbi:MAG TPA: VIT domain-containing protein [Allosphingosinicella sp.]|jgi:hypothetical protein|nr:VIT domain-containing protein [Allosphingosinicella sp.]
MSYSDPDRPGLGLLTFGVILPVLALAIELATGLCAGIFFDPIPTWPHALAVLAVPAINYTLWAAARRDGPASPTLTLAAGAAMAISFVYSLIFLPLLPISVIGVLLLGLGFLPWAPALALVASVKLAGRWVGEPGHSLRRWLGGVLAGLAALVIVDLPATATFLAVGWAGGDSASARRATALMSALGDESMLLRLCYGEGGRAVGLASFAVSTWNEGAFSGRPGATTGPARELYYRATGRPFNAVEGPSRQGQSWWSVDDDQGGTSVGGRAQGLRLAASRIDGSVSSADNLAYLEWTAVFANRMDFAQEARLTLALPPGGVASRATLWVNGEPREASVAGRGEARAAYENVVRASRDPLLVTTDGAGRLLVQAFPVPAGASLKLRIGITAPLDIAPDGARSLALPAIAENNFELPRELRHQIWIEGRGPLGAGDARFRTRTLPSGVTQIRAALDDFQLGRHRPRIAAPRIEAPSTRSAILPATAEAPALHIVQTVARTPLKRPARIILLVDSSVSNREAAAGLDRALGALPAGLPVGLVIAAQEPRQVAARPWSPAQSSRVRQALKDVSFEGGQDNLPALADAIEASGGGGSALLWIHGAQPVEFAYSAARLDQLLERSRDLPRLIRYQAEAGPAFTVAGHPWFEIAREAPPSGDPGADLAALLARLGAGEGWQATRSEAPSRAGPAASVHIARLWGAERLTGAANLQGKERSAAIALAHRLNIVTPVSGAVVLETDAQYKNNGLAVPGAGDVPTVPEPGTWALMALVAALLLWQHRGLLPRRPALR